MGPAPGWRYCTLHDTSVEPCSMGKQSGVELVIAYSEAVVSRSSPRCCLFSCDCVFSLFYLSCLDENTRDAIDSNKCAKLHFFGGIAPGRHAAGLTHNRVFSRAPASLRRAALGREDAASSQRQFWT